MLKRTLLALSMLGLLSLAPAVTVSAQDVDEASERNQLMMSNGRVQRQAMRATGPEAAAAAATLAENYEALKGLFEDPNQRNETLPSAYGEGREAFLAIFEEGIEAARAAEAAALAGDQETYTARIRAVAATCNACHGTYRE